MDTSNQNSSSRNFAKQISLDEYNKQKREYTEKALLELKSQMGEFKKPERSEVQEDSYDDSEDDSNFSDSARVNVIIKNYSEPDKSGNTGLGLRKRRVPSKSTNTSNDKRELSNTIYAQRELDLQEIQKLRNQIKQLKSALAEEERNNHFLKLDLCNVQVDNSDLKKVLSARDNKIKQLESEDSNKWWNIMKLKLFIGFLVLLYINIVLF